MTCDIKLTRGLFFHFYFCCLCDWVNELVFVCVWVCCLFFFCFFFLHFISIFFPAFRLEYCIGWVSAAWHMFFFHALNSVGFCFTTFDITIIRYAIMSALRLRFDCLCARVCVCMWISVLFLLLLVSTVQWYLDLFFSSPKLCADYWISQKETIVLTGELTISNKIMCTKLIAVPIFASLLFFFSLSFFVVISHLLPSCEGNLRHWHPIHTAAAQKVLTQK